MAFSFNIDSVAPNQVSAYEDEILVNLKITDLPSASYFKAAIKYGNSYVGYINSDGEWIKTNSLSKDKDEDYCSNYVYVSDLGTTDLQIIIKTGEEIAAGNYEIKAHRFTESCSSYSEASNSQIVNFNFPTPTPSPTPTPTPAPTPTITPTPTLSSTSTPISTIKPTLQATSKPTQTPKSTPNSSDTNSSKSNVLAARDELRSESEVNNISDKKINEKSKKSFPILALLFIFGGALLIGVSLFPLAKNFIKSYNEKHGEKD